MGREGKDMRLKSLSIKNPEVQNYTKPPCVGCSFSVEICCKDDDQAAVVKTALDGMWTRLNLDVSAVLLGQTKQAEAEPAESEGK